MEVTIVVKVIKDKKVSYKADTFWSLVEELKHAKMHDLDSIDRLINNLLSSLNKSDQTSSTRKSWLNAKIGYDLVIKKEGYSVLETKPGFWIREIQVKDDEFVAVDISRRAKLKNLIEISNEE